MPKYEGWFPKGSYDIRVRFGYNNRILDWPGLNPGGIGKGRSLAWRSPRGAEENGGNK